LTISAWKETSEKGNAYTSLKCREFSNEYNQDPKPAKELDSEKSVLEEDLDDEIPF